MAEMATDSSGVDEDLTATRESGIVQVAEREASPVASAMDLGKNRDEEIEVDTDEGAAHAADAAEDAIIEVSDDEIETAEPPRTLPSPPSSLGVTRSRPPARPSLRPRPPSSALPPPRHTSAPPSSNGAGSSRPGVDPWLLANKTLELTRANARIRELEEQVAYRDARVTELEEQLARAHRKLAELEASAARAGMPEVTEIRRAVSGPAPHAPSSAEATLLPEAARTSEAAVSPNATTANAADDVDDDDLEADADAEDGTPLESIAVRSTSPEEDLQQISGIGPRFEAALRKRGITRLSQIAAWSEADVREVARALRIPKSRIVKGRWVEAAREAIGTHGASE